MKYFDSECERAIQHIKQGEFTEADKIADQVMAFSKSEPDDRAVSKFLYDLGNEYYRAGQYEKALDVTTRASEIDAVLHGIESTVLASDINLLAMIYEKINHFTEAESFYSRSLEIYQKRLGDHHPETVRTLYQIGCFYKNHHYLDQSQSVFRRVYAILEKDDQKNDALYMDLLKQIAESSIANGNTAEQEKFLKESLVVHQRLYGREHIETVTTLESLGKLYFEQGKIDIAEKYYRQAVAICIKFDLPQLVDLRRTIKALESFKKQETKTSFSSPKQAEFVSSSPMTFRKSVQDAYRTSVKCCHSVYRHWSYRKTFGMLLVLAVLTGVLLFMTSNSVLKYAVLKDYPFIGKVALIVGADPNLHTNGIRTLLFDAVEKENTNMVRLLVNVGADVNHRDHQGKTVAFFLQSTTIGRHLLEAGLDLSIADHQGVPPVLETLQKEDYVRLGMFKEMGIDINAKIYEGNSALGWILAICQKEIEPIEAQIQLVRQKRASDNEKKQSSPPDNPQGDRNYLQEYLDRTPESRKLNVPDLAELLKKDNQGRLKIDSNQIRLDEMLKRQLIGSESGIDSRLEEELRLIKTKKNIEEKYAEKIRELASIGANIDEKNDEGQTFLFQSVTEYRPSVTDVLISCGASVEVSDDRDRTPLHQAVGNRLRQISYTTQRESYGFNTYDSNASETVVDDTETVRKLLAAKADVHARTSDGEMPLHIAAACNVSTEVCELLLQNGADINVKDSIGHTPLHYASSHNPNIKMLKYLIAHEADVNAKDILNRTPLDYVSDDENEKKTILTKAGGQFGHDD